MLLSTRVKDRDNHFNLMRLVAATMVLFSHGASLIGVKPAFEPDSHGYIFTLGSMAVNIFFVVSGFLVTGSLVQRRDLVGFVWARALRIFPGLWVMLALTVLLLGPALTSHGVAAYFGDPATSDYFLHCATLIGGMRFYLPGVFETNAFDQMVNRSLWTLPLEWRMYEYLAVAWAVFGLFGAGREKFLRWLAPLLAATGFAVAAQAQAAEGLFDLGATNSYMFCAGACFYLFRDRIVLARLYFCAPLAALALALADPRLFFYAYLALLPLIVIQFAYARCDRLLGFNRRGDTSYGVYIYSFPLQQLIVVAFPGLSLLAFEGLSLAATYAAAALSWRLIEKPALAKKEVFSAATRALLRRPPPVSACG
jgi:peptidoglycan/LPS O-acetylase OafA/YrhL